MSEFIPPAKPIIGDEEREAVDRVLRSGMVAQGPEVAAFEQEFSAHFVQGRPVVGNVHKDGLAAIWNNEPMKEMRERLLVGDPIPCCKDCNYNTQIGHGTYREDTFFVKLDRKV